MAGEKATDVSKGTLYYLPRMVAASAIHDWWKYPEYLIYMTDLIKETK